MAQIIKPNIETRSLHQHRSSYNQNDFPMPVIKTKKSKFASDVESDSAPTDRKPSPLRPTAKHSKLVANQQLSDQAYWGKVKPYCFDALTNTPRVTITPTFLRSLLINLLIIAVLCVAIPILTNRNMFRQPLPPSGYARRLQTQEEAHQVSSMMVSPRYVARKGLIYIFSGVWTTYQLTFLMVLLLGNPGYGDPLIQKQLSLQEQKEILQYPQRRNLQGYSRCATCKAIVDNSVFHCPQCDLCCQGFTHHCEWIGKCIGYRNQIFLNAYYYGFFAGIMMLVLLILLQSVSYQ